MPQKPASPSISAQQSEPRVAKDPKRAAMARGADAGQLVDGLTIEYPVDLPITSHLDELLELIRENQTLVVCGETGSGKSTQLPKICMQAGLGRSGMIGHTQPRRLAARSIAGRLAEEMNVTLGKEVGYQIRFGDQTSAETRIKLMTDGILLAETQSDPELLRYELIIIDEAHERSLNIDFLLGYLRRLQQSRPELKLIITSATIDAERFARHFATERGPAPIVNVEGRGYPVEMRYLPWDEVVEDETRGYDLARHVIAGLESIRRDSDGDTLIFLPTERDIRDVSHRVAGHYQRLGLRDRIDLLPLYARLPQSEQQRIFHPIGGKRRIIFATNVAESSLTVPGIRSVVDTGTARISRYSPRSKMQRLPVEPISQASANQRAGRCGRIGPGICVRLFSADDFDSRDPFTTPEIRRTNLASVILTTKTLRLGALEDFPLLDPPRPEMIREGTRTLIEIGALDERHRLTDIGWKLGHMPVDPRVGRILIEAEHQDALPEVLPIAAALEVQDPRDRPPEKQQAADEAHRPFADQRSDFVSYLRLWKHYQQLRDDCSRSKLTRVLRKSFLSPTRMREWSDVHRQLRELVSESFGNSGRGAKKLKIGRPRYADDADEFLDQQRYAAVHRSLLAGLLSGVAMAGDKREYTGSGGLKLFLWPGSGLFGRTPKWIVAAELVETAKQYARTVAQVQPQWIESAGAHLVKRSHSDPHWSTKSNGVFCYERQSLFGLPIVARRRVPLPPIDPTTARNLLISQGLVEEKLSTSARFVRHNRELRQAFSTLAAKTRRRDLVIDAYAVERFYQQRLPSDLTDRGRIEKHDKTLPQPEWASRLSTRTGLAEWLENPPAVEHDELSLYMRPEDLIDKLGDSIREDDFPDELSVGGSRLPLTYHFEPGSERDGISVRVHQAALSQISDDRLDWLVPGLLEAKLTAMIKALPKRIRRNLVPAADVARQIAGEIGDQYGKVPFMSEVCAAMSRHAEIAISPDDFQQEKLEAHLQFLVEVVGDDGKPLGSARQLSLLKSEIGLTDDAGTATPESVDTEDWARDSMRQFDIDELPQQVVRKRGGVQVAQFPALIDLGDAVATRLFSEPESAEHATRLATTRLYTIAERKELRSQVRHLPSLEEAKIRLRGAIPADQYEQTLTDLLARIAFIEGEAVVRSRAQFENRRADRIRRISIAAQDVAQWLDAFANGYFASRREIESLKSDTYADALNDIRLQTDWLLADRFMSIVPWQWLQHYPRYFQAIAYRLDKLRSGAATRDSEQTKVISDLWERWQSSLPEGEYSPELQAASEFRWMIEELRVSLFAQPLGTSVKVSPKRCEKLLTG